MGSSRLPPSRCAFSRTHWPKLFSSQGSQTSPSKLEGSGETGRGALACAVCWDEVAKVLRIAKRSREELKRMVIGMKTSLPAGGSK